MPSIDNRSGYTDKSIDNIQCCPNNTKSPPKHMIHKGIFVGRAAPNQYGISLLGLPPRRRLETGATVLVTAAGWFVVKNPN